MPTTSILLRGGTLSSPMTGTSSVNRLHCGFVRGAFTLAELLVAVSILAVLIALALVGLGRARAAGLRTQCLANARSCAQAMIIYAVDYSDSFPNSADFSGGRVVFRNGGISLPYWTLTGAWTVPMRGYLGESPLAPQQFCPASYETRILKSGGIEEYLARYPPGYIPPSVYWMSYSMISDPRMWASPPPPFQMAFARVVRHSEVAHPALKGLMIECIPRHLLREEPYGRPVVAIWTPQGANQATTVVMADGSTRSIAPSRLEPPQAPALQPFVPVAPVLATRDGVLGTDLRR